MDKPLLDNVDEREFTDREKEFEFLWKLVEKIKNRRGASYAIISRKGVGKTALLTSFYNTLFMTQKKVIPFYISFAEFKTDEQKMFKLKEFIEYYFRNLISQYISFKLNSPLLLSVIKDYSIYELKEFAKLKELDGVDYLLERYIHLWESKSYHNLLYFVIHFTNEFLGRQDEYGLLIIDEFQVLTGIWDEEAERPRNITDIFQKTAEAKWCPMVVTGSAVHLISKTVFGGLLARRFNPFYLKPFSIEHSVEYAFKLSKIDSIKIIDEVAIQIHQLTGGNPYYIWCIFNSYALEDNNLSTLEKLEQVYTYELNELGGKLRGFWDTHFDTYIELINSSKIGLKALYHLAVSKDDVNVHDLSKHLDQNVVKVRKTLNNLVQSDLIQRKSGGIYDRITDTVLADYVEREYKTDVLKKSLDEYLAEFSADLKRRQGNLARLLGENAELYTRHLLLNFKGQKIDSEKVFGVTGEKIRLPQFTRVEQRQGLIIEGDIIEFDLIAEGTEQWLVEVKYWKKPVSIKDVEKFIEKVQKYEGWSVPPSKDRRLWFFSKYGFQEQAKKKLQTLGILHSDIHGFNLLCQAAGIGMLPIVVP